MMASGENLIPANEVITFFVPYFTGHRILLHGVARMTTRTLPLANLYFVWHSITLLHHTSRAICKVL